MIRNKLLPGFLIMLITAVIGFNLPAVDSPQVSLSSKKNGSIYSNKEVFIDNGNNHNSYVDYFFFPLLGLNLSAKDCGGYIDADGDGYTPCGGDCYDSNPNVYPGSTYWSAADRGDGNFDFDCDGSSTLRWTQFAKCREECSDIPSPWCYCTLETPGWFSNMPGCGQSAQWTDICGYEHLPACGPTLPWYMVQECQ